MITQIDLGGLMVDVELKQIKNIHLRVYPGGRVRISAPRRLGLEAARAFAVSKLDWIKQQQQKFQSQARETAGAAANSYVDGEILFVWGKPYPLKVVAAEQAPCVACSDAELRLTVRPGTDAQKRQALVEGWYREQVRQAALPLITKWEPRMGVSVSRIFVQRMRSRWGTCNPRARTIRLNSELAKKPPEYFEYILVHEMAHLLEASHNARFKALMDRFLPDWRKKKKQLNQSPPGPVSR